MFDRNSKGFLDDIDISSDLHRFENDPYLTKYLVTCFNPEFKIRVTFPKDEPKFSTNSVDVGKRQFKSKGGVI